MLNPNRSSDPRARVVTAAAAWKGVTRAPHRFRATVFQLAGKEFGHLHTGGALDIPFPKQIRDVLVQAGEALQHPYVPDSGWTTFLIQSEADAEHGLRLLRLSYLYWALLMPDAVLTRREVASELDSLALAKPLRALYDVQLARCAERVDWAGDQSTRWAHRLQR